MTTGPLPEGVERGLVVDLLGDFVQLRQGFAPDDRLLLLERDEEVVGCGVKMYGGVVRRSVVRGIWRGVFMAWVFDGMWYVGCDQHVIRRQR